MAYKKKKPKNDVTVLNEKEVEVLLENYDKSLKEDPDLSLKVDPLNKYHFPEDQKLFIQYYCEFKSILTAAEMAHIEVEKAKQYFVSYNSQEEIRRINRAMYHRQFRAKILSLDDIAGYLSSVLMDEVPYSDRLSPTDKLRVIPLLLQVKELKAIAVEDPSVIANQNIELELKNSSIQVIQKLLNEVNSSNPNNPPLVLDNALTTEEKEYLKTLPTKELLNLLNTTNLNTTTNPEKDMNNTINSKVNTTSSTKGGDNLE